MDSLGECNRWTGIDQGSPRKLESSVHLFKVANEKPIEFQNRIKFVKIICSIRRTKH